MIGIPMETLEADMTFVRNCWYVAGWSHEIPRELSTLAVMGEDIVLYRTQAGAPVALEDQCPHKRAHGHTPSPPATCPR